MSEPFIGVIRVFGFNFPPRGWATCAGQLLPIAQNTALFSILGTNFGGNGTTNFALPNLQANMPPPRVIVARADINEGSVVRCHLFEIDDSPVQRATWRNRIRGSPRRRVTPWRNRQCHHRGAFLKVGDALYLRGSAESCLAAACGDPPPKVKFADDSPVEGDGCEPSVPRKETTLVGRPRSIPRNSPSAKETGSFVPGTDGSGESHVRTWGSRPAARRRRQQRREPRLALDQRPSAQVSDQVPFPSSNVRAMSRYPARICRGATVPLARYLQRRSDSMPGSHCCGSISRGCLS
jgi:hypothetical protein